MAIEVVDVPYGRFLVCPGEVTGESLKQVGFWEPFMKDVYDTYVQPDMACIDIGANQGFHTVYMAQRCRMVYAFEPQRFAYWLLCGNLALNYCMNVEALPLAALEREASVTLWHKAVVDPNIPLMPDGTVNYADCVWFAKLALEVTTATGPGVFKAVRVDSVVPLDEPVGLIKCDAQGSDLRALMGCTAIIERWRPIVAFEFETQAVSLYGDDFPAYEEFFRCHHYQLENIRDAGEGEVRDYLATPEGVGV